MILEGFEIENWSCIRKVRVSGLPPSGVIVIHAPNRTGKSSIFNALRAGLMDYASTTTAVKSWYPRGTGEKPVVAVTFRTGGTSYRITKHFGTNKSELASQTASGAWKVETTSAADAHERTCGLVGGSDSAKGLHQLLWLTQAKYELPEAKKFDPGVQAQLRGILGVLQTPLDDRFLDRVKERWGAWYAGQRKVGQQREKAGSRLAENLKKLAADQQELTDSESKYREVEGLLRQAADLEQMLVEWNRQLDEEARALSERQEEQTRSQERILARQQAEANHVHAQQEQRVALDEQRQRADAAQRCLEEERAIGPARDQAKASGCRVKELEELQTKQRNAIGQQRDAQRELQRRTGRVTAGLQKLDDADRLAAAQDVLLRAQGIADAIAQTEKYLAANPAPNKKELEALHVNRQNAERLQAELKAASMRLTLTTDADAALARLVLDGEPVPEATAHSRPAVHNVRRKAELSIPGWGRVEVSRGTGQGDLDQFEADLQRCQEEFASAVARFGVVRSDSQALNLLLARDAEHQVKRGDLENQRKQLKQLAPQGLDPLHAKVVELRTRLAATADDGPSDGHPLPIERGELEELAAGLQMQNNSMIGDLDRLTGELETTQASLDRARKSDATVQAELAACVARAQSKREELDRLRSEEQIAERIAAAQQALESALAQLQHTELTSEERTIDERLRAAAEAVGALERQKGESTKRYHEIKGRLVASEGLHAERASLAARVEELTRLTTRETLERDAVDRLYTLFEECREKQLGTLMGPIHDRVLGWMRALNIGDYQQVRFSDAFLPDKLLTRDGTAEFSLQEESTGAQEQIGMLTRLALGSILAAPGQPAVAILDDPLTHCDQARLHKMRLILRRAAEGDPSLDPPAGPLQIVVLTCHPEWFRDERATVIDLEDPEVMSRRDV